MNIKNRIEVLENIVGNLTKKIGELKEENRTLKEKEDFPILKQSFSFLIWGRGLNGERALYKCRYFVDENGFATYINTEEIDS